jgi:hypothetical protein
MVVKVIFIVFIVEGISSAVRFTDYENSGWQTQHLSAGLLSVVRSGLRVKAAP